jgi:hypothetical protein
LAQELSTSDVLLDEAPVKKVLDSISLESLPEYNMQETAPLVDEVSVESPKLDDIFSAMNLSQVTEEQSQQEVPKEEAESATAATTIDPPMDTETLEEHAIAPLPVESDTIIVQEEQEVNIYQIYHPTSGEPTGINEQPRG